MRLIYIICIITTIAYPKVNAQDISADEIYVKMLLEGAVVYDSLDQALNPLEIHNVFHSIDTILPYTPYADKFTENIYNRGSILIAKSRVVSYDLQWDEADRDYNFIIKQYNEQGEFIKDAILFSIDSVFVSNLDNTIRLEYTNNGKVQNTPNDYWAVQEIIDRGQCIKLDNCNKDYILRLNSNKQYDQKYGQEWVCKSKFDGSRNINSSCSITIDEDILHSIRFRNGIWKTINEFLILTNAENNDLKILRYDIDSEFLEISPYPEYTIRLIKKQYQ